MRTHCEMFSYMYWLYTAPFGFHARHSHPRTIRNIFGLFLWNCVEFPNYAVLHLDSDNVFGIANVLVENAETTEIFLLQQWCEHVSSVTNPHGVKWTGVDSGGSPKYNSGGRALWHSDLHPVSLPTTFCVSPLNGSLNSEQNAWDTTVWI